MAISANIFQKCLPAYSTDIARCGTVTVCDVAVPEADQLDSIFQDAEGNFRVNDALYVSDFEIKACQSIVNGLYDFLMANKVSMTDKLSVSKISQDLYEIRPFVQALQKSIINNEYWTVTNGQDPGGIPDWQVDVASQSSVPLDARWFAVGDRVFIDGQAVDGTSLRTAWQVLSSTVVGPIIRLTLASQNTNSNLDPAKVANPTGGVLIRGVPNVNDYEEFCAQIPGLNTNKLVPFWIETTRYSLCSDAKYEKYHALLMANNPQYKMFGDIEAVKLNQQVGADFQRRWTNAFFFNKALDNQDLNNYNSLEQITTPSIAGLSLVDEGRCVGRRANAVGVYEQLAECGRVFDLQGQVLNLQELFAELYNIMRVRKAIGVPADSIDLFTDSEYAKEIENSIIAYFNLKTGGNSRYVWNVDVKKAKFGFKFRSFELDYPPITLNVVSHEYFDDRLAAAKAVNQEDTGRFIWILDFSGIYPGIIKSSRVTNISGDLADLAKVDSTYMCVMAVDKRTQSLTSFTWTAVVECPESNLILEGISSDTPEHRGESGDDGDFAGEFTTAS
jgi:hypothetical protein